MDVMQFYRYVLLPAFQALPRAWNSQAARQLVLGTLVWESGGLTWIRQRYKAEDGTIEDGRGRGLCQMEPATYAWLYRRISGDPALIEIFGPRDITRLYSDNRHAVHMCRFRYRVVPEALPAAGDWRGQAEYWGAHYQTGQRDGYTAVERRWATTTRNAWAKAVG